MREAAPDISLKGGSTHVRTGSVATVDDTAVAYERDFVPAIFAQWPPKLAEIAAIAPGDRVLDVGCGTGVLAREAAARVAPSGRVTGLDLNEGMLAVARRLRPEIDWRHGDALDLPFADHAFDAVVSQFAFMFFPDRPRALREMWRVLAPGGRLAVAVCAPLEETGGYRLFADILRREAGEDAAAMVEGYFALGDEAELLRLARAAGIADPQDPDVRGLGALRLDRGIRAHRDQRLAARRAHRRSRLRAGPDLDPRGDWASFATTAAGSPFPWAPAS